MCMQVYLYQCCYITVVILQIFMNSKENAYNMYMYAQYVFGHTEN